MASITMKQKVNTEIAAVRRSASIVGAVGDRRCTSVKLLATTESNEEFDYVSIQKGCNTHNQKEHVHPDECQAGRPPKNVQMQ